MVEALTPEILSETALAYSSPNPGDRDPRYATRRWHSNPIKIGTEILVGNHGQTLKQFLEELQFWPEREMYDVFRLDPGPPDKDPQIHVTNVGDRRYDVMPEDHGRRVSSILNLKEIAKNCIEEIEFIDYVEIAGRRQ